MVLFEQTLVPSGLAEPDLETGTLVRVPQDSSSCRTFTVKAVEAVRLTEFSLREPVGGWVMFPPGVPLALPEGAEISLPVCYVGSAGDVSESEVVILGDTVDYRFAIRGESISPPTPGPTPGPTRARPGELVVLFNGTVVARGDNTPSAGEGTLLAAGTGEARCAGYEVVNVGGAAVEVEVVYLGLTQEGVWGLNEGEAVGELGAGEREEIEVCFVGQGPGAQISYNLVVIGSDEPANTYAFTVGGISLP